MNEMIFCPSCGHESLQWNGEKWSCPDCGFVLYNNVAAAVAVVVTCGDEVLFTRRNQEPAKGKLDLSGGFSEPDESAEHTCARELYEELKREVDESRLKYFCSFPNIYPYKNIVYHTMDLFYGYEVEEKFEVSLEESEVSEAVWIHKNNINLEEIAFESQKRFFRKYFQP